MARKIIIGVIAILLIIISVFVARSIVASKPAPPKKSRPTINKYAKTVTVDYQNHQAEILATGRLESANKTTIISEVQGRLVGLKKEFKEGAKFTKGEVMLAVNSEEMLNELKATKSSFLSSLSKILPSIKLDYTQEFSKWKTYTERFDIEAPISELPKIEIKNLKILLANNNIFTSFYNIKNLELRLDKYQIRAPFTCAVISNNIEKGGLIVPGQQLGQIVEIGKHELDLTIQESYSRYVKIGSKVEVFSENSDRSYAGIVSRISNNIDFNTQTRSVFVSINSDDLADGMYLSALIKGKTLENVFKIDRSSIINNRFVNTLNDSLELERSEINLLLTNEKSAYISGLDSGKIVINQSLPNVALGTKIIPLSDEESI